MQKIILLIMLFMLVTIIYPQNPCPGTLTVTYADKTYNTIKIGTQCWLKENLNVGTMLWGFQNQSGNAVIEKYCYNDDPNNCNIYGGLYQWKEAMQYSPSSGKVQGICPPGWHIPTKEEFQILSTAVSDNSNALKLIGQGTGSGVGTNTSGFSVLLAGSRYDPGYFHFLGTNTFFWCSTESNATLANYLYLFYNDSGTYFANYNKENGFSVRCLNDETGTGVEGSIEKGLPTEYLLSQNYPNPFNPKTTIKYSIPKATHVTFKIYNLQGEEITTLINEEKYQGNYEVEFDAGNLSTGVYFYRLQADSFYETKKLVLMK